MFKTFRRRLRQLLTTKSRHTRRRKPVCSQPFEALEERICPSTINFVSNGLVVFGGGSGNNALAVSVTGDTYTFNDPNETITVLGTNIPAPTGSGTNTVMFDASTATTPLTRIIINTNGGTDTVAINGFRGGAEGLEVRDTIAGDTVSINGDVGTSGSRVSSFGVTISGTQVNIGADIFTDNLGVSVTGPVTLTGNSEIDSGTGSLDINNAIDGAFSLTGTGGFVTLDGTIGGTTQPTSLTLTGQTTGVRIQDVSVDGAVDLTGNSVLTQGALTGDGSGALSIGQFTNGNALSLTFMDSDEVTGFSSVNLGDANTGHLQLNNDGDGDVQGTGSLRPGSPITLTGDNVTVGESIDQGANALTVNVDDTLNWAGQGAAIGGGAVTINKINAGGTLTIQGKMGAGKQQWGANALTVNAVGSTVDFAGEVATNVASFTATATTLDFSGVPHGAAIGANGDVTLTATTLQLGGGITSVTGSIVVSAAVTLNLNTTLRAGSGGDITINGTVTSSANHRIIVRGIMGALDEVAFNGAVSGVGNFQIDGSGAASATLGAIEATSIRVIATAMSLSGTIEVVNHGSGLPEGNLHLTGNVTLTGDTDLEYNADTSGRAVRVEGTITGGGNNLGITSLGNVVVTGATTGVNNMNVTSQGTNYVTAPITVTGSFVWITNGGPILVLQDITAGPLIAFSTMARLLNGATLNATVVNNP